MDDILQGETLQHVLFRASINLEYWCERVLGLQLDWFHKEWLNAIRDNKKVAIKAFTGSGKTTICMAYILHESYFNPGYKSLIIANAQKQSIRIMREIQTIIDENDLLSELKPANPDSWSKMQTVCSNKSSITCQTYNKNIRGEHVNFVLSDEASAYKDHEIFFRYVITRVNALNGKLVAISTPESPVDLMEKLFTPQFDGVYWRKAYPILDENGKPISKRFSMERITEIRKQSPSEAAFEREYLLKTVAETEAIYPPKQVMECFDKDLGFVYTPTPPSDKKNKDATLLIDAPSKMFFGCDFAISGSPHADWSATVVIEYISEKYYIRFIETSKGRKLQKQIDDLHDLARTYKPFQLYADMSTFGIAIVQELKTRGLPVIGCDFQPTKRSEYLMTLKRAIEDEKLVIPRNLTDPQCDKLTTKLYEQLISFKTKPRGGTIVYQASGHDDLVMALALAIWGASKQRPYVPLFGN